MRQKYRNDFKRCNGDHCIHRNRCTRYEAHLEAEVLKLERVVYVSPKECKENYYCHLAIEEKR